MGRNNQRRNRRSPALTDGFRRCVLGGVSVSQLSRGFPDGDQNPSVTMDLKTTFTLTPNLATKSISFAIAPNSNGAFVVLDGYCGTQNYGFGGWDGASARGWTAPVFAGNAWNGAYNDSRLNILDASWGTQGPGAFSKFRPIVAVADVVFTGSSMYDGGSVSVNVLSDAFSHSTDANYSTSGGIKTHRVLNSTFAEALASTRSQQTTLTVPARNSFTVRVLGSSVYKDTDQVAYTDPTDNKARFGYPCDFATTGLVPGPVYADCPLKVVTYTGLDSSASVTVSIRYCVQLAVISSSTIGAFASPSPPPSSGDQTWFQSIGQWIPTLETLSAVAKHAKVAYRTASSLAPTLREYYGIADGEL